MTQMIRQFVNLVAEDYTTGARSLHWLDVAKHLFYSSTARAEEASAKNKEKESNNGGNKPPRRIESRLLLQLPPPMMCLQRFPAVDDHGFPPHETFALLGSPDDSDGRILHAGEGGQVLLYNADSGSTVTLPILAEPPIGLGRQPIFISNAGAGAGKEKESLYVIIIDRDFLRQRHSFEVLDLSQLPHRWEHLPPPPFFETSSSCPGLKSFMVVDGGQTICVSAKNKGTYCFDTRSHEWWQAGDWTFPFYGRVDYVPELHSWLGTCFDDLIYLPGGGESDDYLCASSDLSVVVSAMVARGAGAGAAPPKLQHIWQDMNPSDEESIELKGRLRGVVLRRTMRWELRGRHLINLGGGRFCIAKIFEVQRVVTFGFGEDDTEIEEEFVDLSRVEMVHGGDDDGGELLMVKHKSKRYMFDTDEIKCVL